MLLLCRQQPDMISPGEKCLTPPQQGNLFTNLIMWSTIWTTIMPGTIVNGNLWQSEQNFSFKKRMLRSMSPQFCDAATQSKQGAVGRTVVNELIAANSWSPEITVMWKPQLRHMLYVTRRASQIYSFSWYAKWVTMEKQIFVLSPYHFLIIRSQRIPQH